MVVNITRLQSHSVEETNNKFIGIANASESLLELANDMRESILKFKY